MYVQLRETYWDKVKELEDFPIEVTPAQRKQLYKNKRPHLLLKRKPFPEHLDGILMGYQKEGVRFMERRNGRCLLADDMGLGKTLQVLTFAMMHNVKRVVIVCTSTLKFNWEEECEKWGFPDVQVLNGSPSRKNYIDQSKRLLVLNYDIITRWEHDLKKYKPKMIAFDEAHKIKNNKAKRTKSSKAVAKHCDYVIGMTGTPVENAPFELFNICNMIRPGMFDWFDYIYRYCDAKKKGKMGASNTRELHKILSKTVMIRRMKKDVLKELPPKKRIYFKMSLKLTEYQLIRIKL